MAGVSQHLPESETIKRRLFLLGVVAPLTAVSIGVDGGDIFQILAAETLELDPRAVGTALLFGALSIPVQIWAARIPLARARHNIRLYLWLLAAMAFATAALVALAPPGTWIAGLVLAIAVLAEIAVSVLYATSWQPLIAYTLTIDQRQQILGPGRAVTGVALLGAALLFGQLGQVGRALFLVALGLAAMVVGWMLHILPPPPEATPESGPEAPTEAEPEPEPEPAATDEPGTATPPHRDPASLTNVFIALPAVALASWPLLVYYASVVMWPDGNLGLLAGAMALGAVVASARWRNPGDRLINRIRLSAGVVAACSFGIVILGRPIDGVLAATGLLGLVAAGSAARTTLRIGVMELAHRRIDTTNSVRIMTLFDVVGSTSYQVGAFAAGFLIASSVDRSGPIDAYQAWLLATSVALLVAAARFRLRPGDLTA